MRFFGTHLSPLGKLLITATEYGISGLYFEDHRWANTRAHLVNQAGCNNNLYLTLAKQELDAYFARRCQTFTVPLDLTHNATSKCATGFQKKVWMSLTDIPFGQTITYGEHASHIGHANAIRAMGAAIGKNPVSIIVPCHRVTGRSGELTGYAGGLTRKAFLLQLENKNAFPMKEKAIELR